MPYVSGKTVHDADSHIMELPDTINEYFESDYLGRFEQRVKLSKAEQAWGEKARIQHQDPEFQAGADENILLRKNYDALGAFDNNERVQAFDLLGFTSQLVFTTTALSNFGFEHSNFKQKPDIDLAIASSEAHNRMMIDFL